MLVMSIICVIKCCVVSDGVVNVDCVAVISVAVVSGSRRRGHVSNSSSEIIK